MRQSVKQSTLTYTLSAVSIFLLILCVIAFYHILQANDSVLTAQKKRFELITNAKRFMDGSAYLTNEVRAFSATGDQTRYDNFWREVNSLKNRDIGIANLRRIGVTREEDDLVEIMFSLSNNLIPLENKAMMLAIEGRLQDALEIVYGKEYENWIHKIRKTQLDFIEALNVRSESHVEEELTASRVWRRITVFCLAFTALIQLLFIIAVQKKIISPLLAIRDEMSRIAGGNLHTQLTVSPDTSEIGMLVHDIELTKEELNRYISDISDKLSTIAAGKFDTRVAINYIGDFAEIKEAINEIALKLHEQQTRDERHREDLIEALEGAKAANKAKSVFLSNMSHEIRTPMNAIIGMTNIALTSKDPERKEYCLGKVKDASNHLLGVINDVLDMSKIDANKFELSSADFSLEKMMIRVVNFINFRIEEKRQNLKVRIEKNVPTMLLADEQRLAQVITNLLSNAVKFTPEGGTIELSMALQEMTGCDCELLVSVKDSGIGISQEQQQKLFGSFSQADVSISRRFGGTGLGLAISKEIVDRMGGRIWVASQEGEGSTFSFTFRAGCGFSGTDCETPLTDVRWEDLRVLVVDDEADIREYFQSIAERFGFFCDVAASGEDALNKAADAQYDIYFIDWKMPTMDGIELTRRVRERAGSENSVIIMISSVEWESIEAEARDAGVDKYMGKPLFPSLIADTIAECLGAKQSLHRSEPQDSVTDLSGFHILLAEDVEINAEIVQVILESTGVTLTRAENGLEAVKCMTGTPDAFDLIFMDLHMPEMDGKEATVRIRAMDSHKARTIPIIAMTANVFREDVEACLEIGMNDHIGKPLDFDEVLAIIRKYLPARR